MKTKLILGSLLALSSTGYSQWTTGGNGQDVYKTVPAGNLGIGTTAPQFKVDIKLGGNNNLTFDGVSINNAGAAADPAIFLNNIKPFAKNWSMKSIAGSGGIWRLSNETNQLPVMEVLGDGRTFIRTVSIGPSSGRLNVGTDSEPYAVSADNIGQFNATAVRGEAAGNGTAGSFSRGMLSLAYNAEENQGGDFNAYGGSRAKGIICKASGGTSNNTGGHFLSIGNSGGFGTNYGVYAESNTSGYGVGIYAKSIGASPNGFFHYGGIFESNGAGSPKNIGSYSYAGGGSGFNVGVVGAADGTGSNWIPVFPLTYNIGVYGTANLSGPYTSPGNNWAGWFDNDVMINGTGYNSSFGIFTSDRRFKKDIKLIENANSIISKLNPSSYYMTTENEYGLHFSNKKQFGFISQEVEAILPDLVETVHKPAGVDSTGKEVTKAVDFKGLNYMGFIALLTKGIQEQNQKVESLEKQVEAQNQLIFELNNKVATSTGINALSNIETGFQMSQNEPNPFTHETVVKYTLPANVNNAFMAVYDLTGKQVTTFPIGQKGASFITITSEKLSPGIYIYSVVADGKVMDSKRMIVADK